MLVVVPYQSQVFLKQNSIKASSSKESKIMEKKIYFFVLFIAMLMLSTSTLVFSDVQAQGDATVIVATATGGTTDISGTTTYPDGTSFIINAIPDNAYAFVSWTISSDSSSTNSIENPLTITLAGGTTYTIQPNFDLVIAPPGGNLPTDMSSAAIVVVLASAGGSTTPAPGTYAMADATTLQLKATPNSGWQFSYWTICGSSMSHGGYPLNYAPTDNPYTVGHGYGYTYYYQPVFTQIASSGSSATPTPTATATSVGTMAGLTTEMWIIIALIIVIIVMGIGLAVVTTRRKK